MKNKGGRPQKNIYGIVLIPDSEGRLHLPINPMEKFALFNDEVGQLLWATQYEMVSDKMEEEFSSERTPQGLHRLRLYMEWATSNGVPFYQPDLSAFKKAEVARGMKASTVNVRLAGVRRAYRDLLSNTVFRDALWGEAKRQGLTEPDHIRVFFKEIEERMVMRIEERVDSTPTLVQDDEYVRLKPPEVRRLLAAPGTHNLLGLRETAHIALALAIGARSHGIRNLRVRHLHSEYNGRSAARVKGKRNKIRKVPYGNRGVYMEIVWRYLEMAGIENSRDSNEYVIQPFEPDERTPKGTIHNTRMLEYTLAKYPIEINGVSTEVNPHDLRRTYAFSLYHEGMPVEDIAMNMGHSDEKGRPQPDTTWKYIGPKEGDERIPGYAYGEDEYRAAMQQEFKDVPRKIVETQKRRNWTDRIQVRIEKEDRHWFWLDALLQQPTKLETKAINRAAHTLAEQGKIVLWKSRDGYRTDIVARADVTLAELGEAGRYGNEKEGVWMKAQRIK